MLLETIHFHTPICYQVTPTSPKRLVDRLLHLAFKIHLGQQSGEVVIPPLL